jgi:acetyl esterase
MPLDPAARLMLEAMTASGLTFQPGTTPEQRRAAMLRVMPDSARIQPVHAVDDRVIPGPAGEIPVRVFRPSAAPLPILVWFHGGGWVTGSVETHDLVCRQLCAAVDAIVVSVDYRLAPETKFPGAVDDCVAAWSWVAAHAADLGGDPARIAVGGDSAGGNLAAVVELVARDEGLAAPAHQLLVYPVADYEFERPSMVENATGYFLEADTMRWFFDHYARTPDDFADWRMSPLRAPDLAGVAPATVLTAEFDPLRDQGEAYGERLRAAGVPTEILRADGVFHGYFGMQKFLPPAKAPWDLAVSALRAALERTASGTV